jgi:hypothetical protein
VIALPTRNSALDSIARAQTTTARPAITPTSPPRAVVCGRMGLSQTDTIALIPDMTKIGNAAAE